LKHYHFALEAKVRNPPFLSNVSVDTPGYRISGYVLRGRCALAASGRINPRIVEQHDTGINPASKELGPVRFNGNVSLQKMHCSR
jgi:hypothetical protein